MGCTIDHLSMHLRVRVLQDFVDARGASHRAGEQAVIRQLDFDWARDEVVIEWERDREAEKLVFSSAAKTGPRNGHMKEFFADEGMDIPPRPPKKAPPVPPLHSERPITEPVRYAEALDRVEALAIRNRFSDTEEQIQLILAVSDPDGGILQNLAGDLVEIAVAHAGDADRAAYRWLGQRAISLWYAWGSRATSGGEGAARGLSIRAAEARLPDLE